MTPTNRRRSITNVRTHSTRRTSPALAKHELYMKLTSLEIERSRRDTERRATNQRLEMIDERLREIEAEQQQIRDLLDEIPANREEGQERLKETGLNLRY